MPFKARRFLHYFFYLFLLMLSGCGKKQLYRESCSDSWTQQEAKFYDIPTLINANPEQLATQTDEFSDTISFAYSVQLAVESAITFYEQEMDRFGWNLSTSFIGNEVLFIFEKPSKVCSISIRPKNNILYFLIFLKNR